MNTQVAIAIGASMVMISGGADTLAATANTAPAQAAAVGYKSNTFHSTFSNDLQTSGSGSNQVNWYLDKWFTWPSTRPESISIQPGEGITLTNGGDTSNYAIGTAAARKNNPPRHWVGKAFGGGAYFEAEIRFDFASVTQPTGAGFPSWWMMPVEHFADPRTDQWVGQAPGYEHFTEIDVFEYNQWKKHPYLYSGAVHEWYGVYKKTCVPNFCRVSNTNNGGSFNNFVIETPHASDFTQFHKFGLLWIPATDTTKGYLQYYFDGVATDDRITWDKFKNQPPPPDSAGWAFGVTDQLHFVLILGTGNGQPMTVRSVDVWQSSGAQNIQN